MDKFKTFAFTLRPRNGVTDEHLRKIEAYTRKKCEWYHVVTEKTGSERHIHAGWVLKDPSTRSNVATYMNRMFQSLDPDEKKVMNSGLKIMYNEDFIRKYLDKDDDTVVVCSCLPERGYLESYFPPRKVVPVATRLAYHSQLTALESLWREHVAPHVEVNTANARDFLFDMQYSKRLIGIMDDKKLIQTSRWLVRWMNKADRCLLDMPPFEKEEGPGFH